MKSICINERWPLFSFIVLVILLHISEKQTETLIKESHSQDPTILMDFLRLFAKKDILHYLQLMFSTSGSPKYNLCKEVCIYSSRYRVRKDLPFLPSPTLQHVFVIIHFSSTYTLKCKKEDDLHRNSASRHLFWLPSCFSAWSQMLNL